LPCKRRHRRSAAALALLAAVAATPSCGDGGSGTVLGIPNRSSPKLIYAATNEPTGVQDLTFLRDHVAEFEQGPFDGLTVDVGLGNDSFDVAFERSTFDAEVDILRSTPFVRLSDNFQMFNSKRGPVDWFDDASFNTAAGNARVAAEVVRDAGLRGIFFDVEAYADAAWALPTSPPGTPFSAFESQARLRGAQFMSAMLEVLPTITVILTVSFSEVFRGVCLAGGSIEQDRYSLLPAFIDGMLEARARAQAPAPIVDGFIASYVARDPRSFPLYRELIRGNWEGVQMRWFSGNVSFRFGTGVIGWGGQPELGCAADVQSKLTRDMPVGFGIRMDADALLGQNFARDPADFGMNHFTPETLATTLTAALASAEAYVFLWNDTVDWLGASSQPRPPAAYVDAVTKARADTR
jgi:hypothetical protein